MQEITEEFKKVAFKELRKNLHLITLSDNDLLIMAKTIWELIPRIYNEAANDKE